MDAPPFASLGQTLAAACQAQHQELLSLRQEQERSFQVLLENQAQDRAVLKDLERSGSTHSEMGEGIPQVTVTKMGPRDDPEAFLPLFEHTVGLCGWPQDQRAA